VACRAWSGIYSRADDRVVLIVFRRGARRAAHDPEAPEVRAFPPDALPYGELAFWSTEAALRDLLA
jgi:hypothetical protein